ncbi:MAG TPA: hypothetical protein VNI55_01895 [Gaiellaceae bacterium]|nr:hypothetical protein [Gaiellaceae bacterium]
MRGTKEQEAKLRVALGKMVLPDAHRAVMQVYVDHANGAGYAWPGIGTVQARSGYKRAHVYRTLSQLREGDDPLLERERFLRSSENTPTARTHRGRRGQGSSTYRLGRSLRAAAGLYDDPRDLSRQDDETPRSVVVATSTDETPRAETPTTSENACTLGSLIAAKVSEDETPERRNESKPSGNGAVGVGRACAHASELPDLIERAGFAAVAGRGRTLRLADELPDEEREFVLALVETFDAVLVHNHEPATAEIVFDLQRARCDTFGAARELSPRPSMALPPV